MTTSKMAATMTEKWRERPSTQSQLLVRLNSSKGAHQNTHASQMSNIQKFKLENERYARKRDRSSKQSRRDGVLDSKFLQTLETQECLFEVQASMLGKLAALENGAKGFVKTPKLECLELRERLKEIEDSLLLLRY